MGQSKGTTAKLSVITLQMTCMMPLDTYFIYLITSKKPVMSYSQPPVKLATLFNQMMQRVGGRAIPNLVGDRAIKFSWVSSQMPSGPGQAVDFGPEDNFLGLIAAQREFNVTAVDLRPIQWYYVHPHLQFIRGDILKLSLSTNHFDLIISCSVVEHASLVRRYDTTENNLDGDLKAMARIRELMKPNGLMLLTVPAGQDAVFAPKHRIYGPSRLPKLLEGFTIEKEFFWIKDIQNRWVPTERITALNFRAKADSWNALKMYTHWYALSCRERSRTRR